MGQIVVFSKTKCPHCVAAKTALAEQSIPYTEINIEDNDYNADLMAYASQKATVPQIFFNDRHIGGNLELNKLSPDEMESQAQAAICEANDPVFLTNPPSSQELKDASLPLRVMLDPIIPQNIYNNPEYMPVKLFYGNLFNAFICTYDYMAIKPNILAVWVPTLIEGVRLSMQLPAGASFYGNMALAFAMPSGCDYCASHSEERIEVDGDDEHRTAIEQLKEHIRGNLSLDDLPFTEQEKAFVNIGIRVSSGKLDTSDMERLEKAVGLENVLQEAKNIGGFSLVMGMMNRWHDMIGLDRNDHHHEFEEAGGVREHLRSEERVVLDESLPLSEAQMNMMQEIMERAHRSVESYFEKYEMFPKEWLPDWIDTLPSPEAVRSMGSYYQASLHEGNLDSDLKHLACYASAKESSFDDIAAEELRIMKLSTQDQAKMEQRLALTDKHHFKGEFDAVAEVDPELALILEIAHYACPMPVFIPGHLTKRVLKVFDGEQICELVLALSGIAMAQRWVPIWNEAEAYVESKK